MGNWRLNFIGINSGRVFLEGGLKLIYFFALGVGGRGLSAFVGTA